MAERFETGLQDELAEMGELLRENRCQPSALELDEIKRQALARARTGRDCEGKWT